MRRESIRTAWECHAFLIVAATLSLASGVVAILLGLGGRAAGGLGISASPIAGLVLPLAVALGFLALHAWGERKRRQGYEWNLIKTNLSLRQNAAAMERLVRVDALTGLDNRRGWFEKLEQEWRRAEPYGRPPAVIMLDLDHFKMVNDRHGHDAGDQLLCVVGEILREGLRTTDVVGRLGGGEFAVLLPEATEDEARVVAEKMAERLARDLPRRDPHGVGVTISAGVCSGRSDAVAGARELLRRADAALYDAKAAGRDCVVVAPAEQGLTEQAPIERGPTERAPRVAA